MAFVTNSVGLGAKNFPQDVKIIQWMLIRAQTFYGSPKLFSNTYSLFESGIADEQTNAAIKDLMISYLGIPIDLTPTSSKPNTFSDSSLIVNFRLGKPIIFPNDRTYKFLLKCSLKPICSVCTEGGDVKVDFNNNPLALQAISERINFQTFKHAAEIKDGETICRSLTKEGIEAKNLLKDPRVRAFLDMIAVVEGTDGSHTDQIQQGYDLEGGSAHLPRIINDLSQHPGKSASGRYQAIPGTWSEAQIKLGITDFTPESQDVFGVWKLMTRGMINDILNGQISNAIDKGSFEWASLPNTAATFQNNNRPTSALTYSRGVNKGKPQPVPRSASELNQIYNEALKSYQKRN